jgi:hypothetical protein
MLESPAPIEFVDADALVSTEISDLHARCGVYTKPSMVEKILDGIGWTADTDLARSCLLEPAAGDGAFVIEAAKRLLSSFQKHGHPVSVEGLAERISAFELLEDEAAKGRAALAAILAEGGLAKVAAKELSESWLRTDDFLLHQLVPGSFSHVAGNPPYARWAKIPVGLRKAYERVLPSSIAKGDLFLPFLDRGIEALSVGGRLGFLCSNRWQFMAFAEGFREKRLPHVQVLQNEEVNADEVYQRSVDIYPSVLILERRSALVAAPAVKRQAKTLNEAGFDVRVGPALGCTDAYVLPPNCPDEIEAELLAPWVNAQDVHEGQINVSGRQVICLYGDDGRLRDPRDFPAAYRWLLRFRKQLEARSVVALHGAPWYRPIDRVYAAAWAGPKLLIPELAKTPRVAMDRSGAVPAHGLYSIMARGPNADLEALHARLADGGLTRALDGRAPKVKGGYVRCYKRFLDAINI